MNNLCVSIKKDSEGLSSFLSGNCLLSAPAAPRKTRAELMKDIDAFYYGYGDEDDGVIVPLEKEEENEGNSTLYHVKWAASREQVPNGFFL